MALRRTLALAASATTILAAVHGCSSDETGTSNTGGDDSGAESGQDARKDRGAPSGDDSGDDTGDDGSTLVCPPKDTSSFTPPAYVDSVPNQGVCSPADIAAFIAVCGDNYDQTKCGNWVNANVGSSGNACGNCIFAPKNNGGAWNDPNNLFSPDYGGCIQITDPVNGHACAVAFDAISACEGFACDQCQSNADYAACLKAADQGGCKQYVTAYQSACATDLADGGAMQTCSPGAANNVQDPDFTYIITLICGGGDGGAADAGSDATGDAPAEAPAADAPAEGGDAAGDAPAG